MAAGIIDHESGTRDIRRLSGLCRFMPITATLAMVAAAAMAGVPLLNGFLSKEMFFSEALQVEGPVPRSTARCRSSPRSGACSASRTRCASSTACSSAPAPSGLPREPHEPPRWMRFPIELLVLACLRGRASCRRSPSGRSSTSRCARCSAREPRLQPRGLARLQPAARHEPRRPRPGARSSTSSSCSATLGRGRERTPFLPPIEGRRRLRALARRLVALRAPR